MTEGPLGGPRPFAEANVQLTFISEYNPKFSERDLADQIGQLLGHRVDVATGLREEGGGGNVWEEFMRGEERGGYTITVTVNTNQVTLEALNLAVDAVNKSVREKIPKEQILIGTTGGEGPAGMGRPIAETSVNMMLNSEDEHFAASEIVVESQLQGRYGGGLQVTVSEGMQFAGETVTVITGNAELPFDEAEGIHHSVEEITDHQFAARNVDVTAR